MAQENINLIIENLSDGPREINLFDAIHNQKNIAAQQNDGVFIKAMYSNLSYQDYCEAIHWMKDNESGLHVEFIEATVGDKSEWPASFDNNSRLGMVITIEDTDLKLGNPYLILKSEQPFAQVIGIGMKTSFHIKYTTKLSFNMKPKTAMTLRFQCETRAKIGDAPAPPGAKLPPGSTFLNLDQDNFPKRENKKKVEDSDITIHFYLLRLYVRKKLIADSQLGTIMILHEGTTSHRKLIQEAMSTEPERNVWLDANKIEDAARHEMILIKWPGGKAAVEFNDDKFWCFARTTELVPVEIMKAVTHYLIPE